MTKKYSYILFILLISVLFLFFSFPGEALKGKHSNDGRYIDHGDGTITDTRTNLMWAKKDSYADLGKLLDWNDSKNYVSSLNTGGHADWRLPTVEELKKIYEESKSNKTYNGRPIYLDSIFASGGAWWYWSSETAGSCCARRVYFTDGDIDRGTRDSGFFTGVRAVRR